MKKVLLIQNTISPYRVPIYNKIAESFDLKAIYSYGNIPQGVNFEVERITTKTFWKFTIHNKNLYKIAKGYDVVLSVMSPTWLSITSLLWHPFRRYKFIPWGIGVPASYSVHYDDPKKSTTLLKYMIKKSDASLFYTDYPVEKYSKMGINPEKLFVAYNTVQVLDPDRNRERNTFLFVGSLYKAKGIDALLDIYRKLYAINKSIPKLRIVGGGSEYDRVCSLIKEYELDNQIIMEGAVYDESKLRDFYAQAIICISPNQAGLSVQKSMGYGVPFVTSRNSFTGGEIFDIENGINGILYDSDDDLFKILIDAADNINKYKSLGDNARKFYLENRTIQDMFNGVDAAVKYVCK